ncbi:hypothetical protein DRJ48_02080 [Candidatus Woesearchaeota archaeon]|nr:MAG: hypothetical protein DRJ48_02080 [Candidatus Woesearchaeota archaeon]
MSTSSQGIGYSHIAPSYDELYGEEQLEKLRQVLRYIKVGGDWLVLDVGCGTGLSSSLLKCERIGLDASMDMLLNSKDKALLRVCGEAEHLPFKSNVFDLVICLTAVHNFHDFEAAIKEMRRVSKGSIVISILKRAKKYAKILASVRGQLKLINVVDNPKDKIIIAEP